jgi:hypothetical protein
MLHWQATLRVLRALLACLIVFLAFAPPASSAPLAPTVEAPRVNAAAQASVARRAESPRVAHTGPTEPVRELLAVRTGAPPRDPLPAVRRLYTELCSLLL